MQIVQEVQELRASVSHYRRLADRLARASAHGAELVAEIDQKNQELEHLNAALADANARTTELMMALHQRSDELERALAEVRTLQGVLPICMHCHSIRTDADQWHKLEEYVERHSHAKFSHALCERCFEKHHPQRRPR